MLSPMIPVLILLSWLRDVGASGELCNVTGRLPGEKVELDFPGRRLGGIDADVARACCAPDGTPACCAPDGTPSGDSKLRLLAISSLPGLFAPASESTAASNPATASNPSGAGVAPATSPATTPAAIIPGDLILIIGRSGELLHAGTVTSDGRLAHIPLKVFSSYMSAETVGDVPKTGTSRSKSANFVGNVPKNGTSRTLASVAAWSQTPRKVSARSVAAYCSRWRRAAGVMVLRQPWLPYHYTKREVLIPMRDGVRLYTAIYEPRELAAAASPAGSTAPAASPAGISPKPIVLVRNPYPVGTYGHGGPGDLLDKIRCFTERGYIIVEQNVRGTYMSEGIFEDCRPLGGASPAATPAPTDESTDAYDTIDWLIANTRNNGAVGIYGVSYPGFYATCAAICGHPALKIVSPQAPVTDWWMGDDAHHNGALMLCDMYGFGASFFRPKGNPTPDSAESLSEIPEDADLYTWFRGRPVADLLAPFVGGSDGGAKSAGSTGAAVAPLKGFADIVAHPDYDAFWQERNPLRHLKGVRPAMLVVGGLYDAEDAWGPEHTLTALRQQNPKTDVYGVFGPWTHGGWRKDPDFLERIELPLFEYYLEGKGEKPAWRDLLIPTEEPGENLAPGKEFLTEQSLGQTKTGWQMRAGRQSFAIAPGQYISDPANPVPYMEGESPWRDKAYMWGDQRFAAARPDVLMQVLEGDLKEDYLAVGPVHVELKFSVAPVQDSAPALDVDIVVKLIDVAPEGTQTLVRGDVCPARWRNAPAPSAPAAAPVASSAPATSPGTAPSTAPAPLAPDIPATLSFDMAAVCHRFAAGHSIALQIQSSWFPLVAMNPQTFLPNPYTATAKDYRPVEVSILAGSSIILP